MAISKYNANILTSFWSKWTDMWQAGGQTESGAWGLLGTLCYQGMIKWLSKLTVFLTWDDKIDWYKWN